ncbi:MAG: hypothetical protein V8R83_08295 [Candidatus Gastranaerophilaceae bacterium]
MGSDAHQGLNHDYTLISALTNYNAKFFKSFNLVTRNINGGSDLCVGLLEFLQADVNIMLMHTVQAVRAACFTTTYGASTTERQQANSGQNGYIAIVKGPVYAGLGGGAGKSLQIPYADMPGRTLLFPGKGGKGEHASPNVYY